MAAALADWPGDWPLGRLRGWHVVTTAAVPSLKVWPDSSARRSEPMGRVRYICWTHGEELTAALRRRVSIECTAGSVCRARRSCSRSSRYAASVVASLRRTRRTRVRVDLPGRRCDPVPGRTRRRCELRQASTPMVPDSVLLPGRQASAPKGTRQDNRSRSRSLRKPSSLDCGISSRAMDRIAVGCE